MRYKEGSVNHRVKRVKQKKYTSKLLKSADKYIKNGSVPDNMNCYTSLNGYWIKDDHVVRYQTTNGWRKSLKYANRSYRRRANNSYEPVSNKSRWSRDWINW